MVVRPAYCMVLSVGLSKLERSHIQRVRVVEMRMIRWMCGHTRFDKIRNEVIRSKTGVATIEDTMREARLRWFGHIRRSMDAPVRRYEKIDWPEHRRSRGRSKKS